MKKFIAISLMAIIGLVFYGCEDEGAELYSVMVEVLYPEGYDFEVREGIPVSMSNMLTGVDYEGVTNHLDHAVFNVEGGTYNVTAFFETEDFSYSGILENQAVEMDGQLFQVQLNAVAKTGGLVLSEIFFAGSTTPEGTNYNNDIYVEIYNNSDEVIYIDGLCIGLHGQNAINPSQWIDEDGNMLDRIPITFQSWMFPGTGETYPVEPRTAIVLANVAMNHQADTLNPLSPVDLSEADFEAFIDHPRGTPDNVNVPNMVMMYTTSAAMNNWTLDVNGRAVPIWRLPTGLDWETFVDDPANFMQNPVTGRGFFHFMVHVDWVVDAVDIVRPEADRRNKQLPTVVDAGMIWNDQGRGHSVRRKVDMISDGRAILRNTNNASLDWIGGVIPTPGQVPDVVD